MTSSQPQSTSTVTVTRTTTSTAPTLISTATVTSTGTDSNTTDTAYDCCVAALNSPDSATIFAFDISGDGTCAFGVLDGTCPAQNTEQNSIGTGTEYGVFGNGYCGEVTSTT